MKSRSQFLILFGIHEIIIMMISLRGVVQAFGQGSAPFHPLELTSWGAGTLSTGHRHRSFSRLSPRSTEQTKLHVSTETSRTLSPGSHISEMEVKKSRFLGYAKHVENWAEATSYIDQVKEEHPKARHWCYGFQCGVNPIAERCSDDGEPTGTAGLPILGAIKGEGLSDVVCVVVRYFGAYTLQDNSPASCCSVGEDLSDFFEKMVLFTPGGIKLGAGGLIRAYGAAARQVLRDAPVDVLIPKSTFRVSVTNENVGVIYDAVAKAGGSTTDEEYGSDGTLSVTVTCELAAVEQLRTGLTDATRGSAKFQDDPA